MALGVLEYFEVRGRLNEILILKIKGEDIIEMDVELLVDVSCASKRQGLECDVWP